MPGNTKTFSVTNAADVAVTAVNFTQQITVAEDPSVAGWPTVDYTIKKPTAAATAIQRPAGAKYIFRRADGQFYAKGEVAGYIRTASGTTTFQQDELGV